MKRKVGGYFTVEATMVLPMIMAVTLLVIYLFLFRYNRCLMEQDVGILAMRGAALQTENGEERMRQLREHAESLYRAKYIAWESGEIVLKLEKGTVAVQQSAQIKFPFGMPGMGNRIADTSTTRKNHIVSPIFFIRSYRKIMGGQ